MGLFHKTLKDAEKLAEKGDKNAVLKILGDHREECDKVQAEVVQNLDHAFTWYKNEIGGIIHSCFTGEIKNCKELRSNIRFSRIKDLEGIKKALDKIKHFVDNQ